MSDLTDLVRRTAEYIRADVAVIHAELDSNPYWGSGGTPDQRYVLGVESALGDPADPAGSFAAHWTPSAAMLIANILAAAADEAEFGDDQTPAFRRVLAIARAYRGQVEEAPQPAQPGLYEPREGDDVEIVLSGRVSHGGIELGVPCRPAVYCKPRGFFDGEAFAQLIDAGAVRLVGRPAPVFEQHRIYRSATTGFRYFLTTDATAPWICLDGDGSRYLEMTEVPDDLELMDLVPAKEES